MSAMAIPCRHVGVAQVRPRSKPMSSSPIQDISPSQCQGLLFKPINFISRLRTSSIWVSLLSFNHKNSNLGMWCRRETLNLRMLLLKTEMWFSFLYIPDVCNASRDWSLFLFAINCDNECWIQCRSGKKRRSLWLKLIICNFLKPLKESLIICDILLFRICKFSRQSFKLHSWGSDVSLLNFKWSVDTSLSPQKAPASTRFRSIFERPSSYNKDNVELYRDNSSLYAWLTVYPKKHAHGFVVLCFVVVMQTFIMNSHEVFIHIH